MEEGFVEISAKAESILGKKTTVKSQYHNRSYFHYRNFGKYERAPK